MKLEEIEREAAGLTEQERAALVLSLLDTLSSQETDTSDEEAIRRDTELDSGVAPISHEEFVRQVRDGRAK